METYVVLENVENGLFITPEKNLKFIDLTTNLRIPKDKEANILNAFSHTNLKPLDKQVQSGQAGNLVFYKYKEDRDDELIWVEDKTDPRNEIKQ